MQNPFRKNAVLLKGLGSLLLLLIIFCSSAACTFPPSDEGTEQPEETTSFFDKPFYSARLADADEIILLTDLPDASGMSNKGSFYTREASGILQPLVFVDADDTIQDISYEAVAIEDINSNYSLMVLTRGEPEDSSVSAPMEAYLLEKSNGSLFLLNDVLNDMKEFGGVNMNMSWTERTAAVTCGYYLDANNNLYTDATEGEMGAGTGRRLIKISFSDINHSASGEYLSAEGLGVYQFAADNTGNCVFEIRNGSSQFAYISAGGSTGFLTEPEVNHDFIRVFRAPDEQIYIVSTDNASYSPAMYKVDFSTAVPDLIQVASVPSDAGFGLGFSMLRNVSGIYFYAERGVTKVAQDLTVTYNSAGLVSGAEQLLKDNRYVFSVQDNDDASSILGISDIVSDLVMGINYNGSQYDFISIRDLPEYSSSVLLTLKETLTGKIIHLVAESDGSATPFTDFIQSRRIVKIIDL